MNIQESIETIECRDREIVQLDARITILENQIRHNTKIANSNTKAVDRSFRWIQLYTLVIFGLSLFMSEPSDYANKISSSINTHISLFKSTK